MASSRPPTGCPSFPRGDAHKPDQPEFRGLAQLIIAEQRSGPVATQKLVPLRAFTCHALYHRGTYKQGSIYWWKAMLVAITRTFDVESIDALHFLETRKKDFLIVSGDGHRRIASVAGGQEPAPSLTPPPRAPAFCAGGLPLPP